jgi:2-methylcitrate dehydratase PrpD
MTPSATKRLAAYIADPRPLPAAAAVAAKLHIADTLACLYAGTGTAAVKVLADANHWAGTPGDVPVPGWGYAKTADGAAQMLGTAAHAHDFDDTSFKVPFHPSAPIVAALLATSFELSGNQGRGPGGAAFIHAYVKGVEVSCKLGEILGDDHTDQAWHTISTLGTLGAAAACAELRGLDAGQSELALAIASSHAGGILNNSGTMVKPLHCGMAARSGTMAAALAERGFTAGIDVLEGSYGFVHAFTGGRRSALDLQEPRSTVTFLPPLTGEHFEIEYPGIEVKRYPCCQVAHAAIDGMRRIRARDDFRAADVEKVFCYVSTRKRMSYLQCPDPRTSTEARFSMNFAVATAMRHGDVALEHFSTEALASEELRRIMRRVEMRLQEKPSADAMDIEVLFTDGRRIGERGSRTPASWAEVVSKLEGCMSHALRPTDSRTLLADLQALDTREDLCGIFHPRNH